MPDDERPAADDVPSGGEAPRANDMPPADDTSGAEPADTPEPKPGTMPGTMSGTMPGTMPVRRHKARRWGLITLVLVLLLPALIFGAWAWITLSYSYSKGLRSGYVQKLSRKGWLCKTWEGELAMVNLPGAMPEIFYFSVRNDSIARVLEKNVGRRVSLFYEEHRGVPTSCFAETPYYITNVRPADQ